MYELDSMYGSAYFGARMDWKPPVYKTIANHINSVFPGCNVVDVGCGNGVLLEWMVGFGIEGSDVGVKVCRAKGLHVIQHDLRYTIDASRLPAADLVVSIEVAEHLEPQYADVFLETLCAFDAPIILTASPKVERYHYNPQHKSYWVAKMSDRGFKEVESSLITSLQTAIPHKYNYLWKNMMVFEG